MVDETVGTSETPLIALRERVKELAALHEVARLVQQDCLDLALLIEQTVRLIPPAFLHPDRTAASVRHGDLVCSTPAFRDSRWMLRGAYVTRAGIAGGIDVAYLHDGEARPGGPFLEEERRLLDSLTEMLRLAAQRRESDAEIAAQKEALKAALSESRAERDRVAVLLEVTNAVSSTLDLRTLITKISDLLRDTVPHLMANLALWDEDAGALRRVRVILPGGGSPPAQLGEGSIIERGWPAEVVFRRGETTLFDDAIPGDLPAELLDTTRPMGMRCGCGVPLQTARGRIGALLMGSNKPGPFPDAERRLLEQIAPQLAIAIENAQQFDRAERFRRQVALQRDRLQLLLAVNNAVIAHLDPRELRTSVFAAMKRAIPHDYAAISLRDRETGELRLEAMTLHDDRGVIEPHTLVPLDRSPTGLAYRERSTQVFDTAAMAAMAADMPHFPKGAPTLHACSVPLLTGRGAVGALAIGRASPQPFSPADLELLNEVAGQVAIAVENTNAYGEIAALKDRLTEEKTYLQGELTEHADFAGIIGHSAGLREVLHNVRTVAPTDATVLLLGETGTGKEVIARSIHDTSRRRDRTFVRVNAAAVPAALFESELFGYERGAFTGAVGSKIGRLELAHRGTLFLDEIGDLPLDLQPKLLRALQEHEFERLGSTRTQKVDVRLVAATNHDLETMVEAGTFRSDLFYRLSVFPIRLPPLRDRREDIQPLVWHFVRKFSTELGRSITAIPVSALTRLMDWDWPGNIRELQNVIERAVILSPGPSLDVPESAFQSKAAAPPAAVNRSAGTFQEGEREIILRALREARGIVGGPQGAAARLGLKRTTLAAKMKKLGIARPTY